MLNYYPPSGGPGCLLGAARGVGGAAAATPAGGGGHPPPPPSSRFPLANPLPAGCHPFYACACLWSGAWVSREKRGCASFVYRISLPISCLLACKFKCACTRLPFPFFRLAVFFSLFPMKREISALSRQRREAISQLRRS